MEHMRRAQRRRRNIVNSVQDVVVIRLWMRTASSMKLFRSGSSGRCGDPVKEISGECRLRRRHHRRWHSISGRYPSRRQYQLVQVGLEVQDFHQHRYHREVQVLLLVREVLVGRPNRVGQVVREVQVVLI
jgi:hypothetical protein